MEKFQAGQGIPWGRRLKKIIETHSVYFMSSTVFKNLYPLIHLMLKINFWGRYLTIFILYVRSPRQLTCQCHTPSKRSSWNLSPSNLLLESMRFIFGLRQNCSTWIFIPCRALKPRYSFNNLKTKMTIWKKYWIVLLKLTCSRLFHVWFPSLCIFGGNFSVWVLSLMWKSELKHSSALIAGDLASRRHTRLELEKTDIAWSFCFSGVWCWWQDKFPDTEVTSVLEAIMMAVNQTLVWYLVVWWQKWYWWQFFTSSLVWFHPLLSLEI